MSPQQRPREFSIPSSSTQSPSVCWLGHQPALRLDVRGKITHQRILVFARPFTLHESAITLIRPDELLHRAEAHEAFALGNNRCRWAKHRARNFSVFAHDHQSLRCAAIGL